MDTLIRGRSGGGWIRAVVWVLCSERIGYAIPHDTRSITPQPPPIRSEFHIPPPSPAEAQSTVSPATLLLSRRSQQTYRIPPFPALHSFPLGQYRLLPPVSCAPKSFRHTTSHGTDYHSLFTRLLPLWPRKSTCVGVCYDGVCGAGVFG